MMPLYRFWVCLLVFTAGCDGFSDLPGEKKRAPNAPPTAPGIVLNVSQAEDVYRLSAAVVSASTDPDGDSVGYRYTWYRNGEPQLLPFSQTEVTEAVAGGRYEVKWAAIVTPYDDLADGPAAQAEKVLAVCGSKKGVEAGETFIDCENAFVFSAKVTAITGYRPVDRGQVVKERFASIVSGTAGIYEKERFTNFIDLVFKQITDGNSATPVSYDTLTYRYLRGYEPLPRQERECLGFPLLGTVCLHGFLTDHHNETGARFFDYDATQATVSLTDQSVGEAIEYSVEVTVYGSRFDYLWEPPADLALTDVADGGAGYVPAHDLSTYLKATGTATYDRLTLKFFVRVAEMRPDTVMFDLDEIRLGEPTFTFEAGPFCNHNLGTTGSLATAFRPFSPLGAANYPGLVSDTASNANPGVAVGTYYSLTLAGYPAVSSNLNGAPGSYAGGGSGAGRDRVGVGSLPYAYGLSDNPNNCRVPADACTSTVAPTQHGGPDAGAGCEYPNISNDADDATYKISQAVVNQGPVTLMMEGADAKKVIGGLSRLRFP